MDDILRVEFKQNTFQNGGLYSSILECGGMSSIIPRSSTCGRSCNKVRHMGGQRFPLSLQSVLMQIRGGSHCDTPLSFPDHYFTRFSCGIKNSKPVWLLLRPAEKICAVASGLVEPLCLVPPVTPAIKCYKISTKQDHVFRPILFHSGKL